MQRLLATKIQWPEAVEMDPSFSFLYENNIHHFDLILLPGLTLHTEINQSIFNQSLLILNNLKKKEHAQLAYSVSYSRRVVQGKKEKNKINQFVSLK